MGVRKEEVGGYGGGRRRRRKEKKEVKYRAACTGKLLGIAERLVL
jgi:hypothetical protein